MAKQKSIANVVAEQQSMEAKVRAALSSDGKGKKLDPKAQAVYDSFTNFLAKMGIGTDNLSTASTYGFNPISRNRVMLDWIHRGSWLGGVAVDLVSNDMTRAGVVLKGSLKPDKIEEINERATTLGIWNAICKVIKWSRLYGGCLGVLMLDGQDMSKPLLLDRVGKDQFKGIHVLDRWMVEPDLNELITDMGPNIGLPKYYRVTSQSTAFAGKRIHYSRCLRLAGIDLPYWSHIAENLWGISVLERLYDRMVAFDSATTGAAQLVYKAYLRTVKIDGLRSAIAEGGPAIDGVVKYVDMMRRFQSIEGLTLLDKDDEFEAHTHGAFTGLDTALNAFGQQLAGALQIPLVRLFGQDPKGMNATGESDLRTYYDGILQQQESTLKVPCTTIYRCIAQSIGIELPDGFSLGFRPLWQLTEIERAEVAGKNCDTVTKALEAGIITPQIAMKELKQQSEITGVFTNITDADISKADDQLPPSPQELMEAAAEQEPGDVGEGPNPKKNPKEKEK